MLYDDFGYATKELRVLPAGGDSNILVGYRGYLKEIKFRRLRNKELANWAAFKLPSWEDLRIYATEENFSNYKDL